MSNFRDLTAGLLAAGGAIQVASAAELTAVVGRLLEMPEERARVAANGRAFMAAQGEALPLTLAALAPWLGGVQPTSP
jgi:3-deoxy-D-manno-octulosonic-acid transferase